MKKVILLFVLLLALSGCGQNNIQQSLSTNTQSKQHIQSNQNNLSEQISKQTDQDTQDMLEPRSQPVENLQKVATGNQEKKNTSTNLAEIESKKLEKIANLKSGLYFYWLDCKKLFKLPENIKKCEMW